MPLSIVFAVQGELDKSFSAIKYDYEAITNQFAEEETIKEVAAQIEDIESYEAWSVCNGKLQYTDGKLGNLFTFYSIKEALSFE